MRTTTYRDVEWPDLESRIAALQIVVLAGGVGGAKLADGMAQVVPSENLTVIVNTGDDFQHLGLTICPDLDTVMYNLAGLANPVTGWGRSDESWRSIDEVSRLGGPDWFRLGDLDLATHLTRTHLMSSGQTLTSATQHLCRHFGVGARLLPMSDQPAPTLIETEEAILSFQSWFVERQWQPAVKAVRLPDDVRATPDVVRTLQEAAVVIIAPSNPFVSIDPILNVYPIRAMIADVPEMVMAVSPIVAGQAIKGPAAKMMAEMGMPVSAAAVAAYYDDLVDVFVYDQRDDEWPDQSEKVACQTDTLMTDGTSRRRLARQLLQLSLELIET
jgi:LPPG:FO 2-phospho-L-lactate transferase